MWFPLRALVVAVGCWMLQRGNGALLRKAVQPGGPELGLADSRWQPRTVQQPTEPSLDGPTVINHNPGQAKTGGPAALGLFTFGDADHSRHSARNSFPTILDFAPSQLQFNHQPLDLGKATTHHSEPKPIIRSISQCQHCLRDLHPPCNLPAAGSANRTSWTCPTMTSSRSTWRARKFRQRAEARISRRARPRGREWASHLRRSKR
jgi:hypothetical protein